MKAPVARYIAAVKDIEQFEKGGNFLVTKRISSPPRLEDFALLTFPPDDIADLKTCKVGSCELKLGEAGLKRIKSEVDWSKPGRPPTSRRSVRRMALDYVRAIVQGGNERLATIVTRAVRRSSRRNSPRWSTECLSLTEYLPELKRYLLGFPKVTLPKSESFITGRRRSSD